MPQVGGFPAMAADDAPCVTRSQMVEVDRLMVHEYGVDLATMMESAGRNLARLVQNEFLYHSGDCSRVAILAGSGGNGGGAMVAARRLHCWGAKVSVFCTRAIGALGSVVARQARILRQFGVEVSERGAPDSDEAFDVVVDGVIGYSLCGPPRGVATALIRWARDQTAPVVALDVPSGVDSTTGAIQRPAVVAAATLTLALPKTGLRAAAARSHVGDLYLADIGVPPRLFASTSLGLEVGALFTAGEILRLVTL